MKKLILFPIIILVILFILLFIFIEYQYGVFDNHSGMYKENLPIEEPAKGGTLYIPDSWSFVKNNNFYEIVDNTNNEIIAYEAYHGYKIKSERYTDKYDWCEYEENPSISFLNYGITISKSSSNGENHCILENYGTYYGLRFYDVCNFKSDEYKSRIYDREYLIPYYKNEEVLEIISRSYSWFGDVE